ncbi:hypothetical protein QBC45DRAFT_453181 [Copromyces sp. CBS 386.78]|nr:hypothetical protein QBC45DRAFT_453181 [Copromyces sp. CBS 386.78]
MLFGSGSVFRPVKPALGELSNTERTSDILRAERYTLAPTCKCLCATNVTVGIILAIHDRHSQLGLAGCDVDGWAPSSRPPAPPPPAPPVPTTGPSRKQD